MNLTIRLTNFLRFHRMPDHKFREVLGSSITLRILQEKVPACYDSFTMNVTLISCDQVLVRRDSTTFVCNGNVNYRLR
jgi:hypothetical protein